MSRRAGSFRRISGPTCWSAAPRFSKGGAIIFSSTRRLGVERCRAAVEIPVRCVPSFSLPPLRGSDPPE